MSRPTDPAGRLNDAAILAGSAGVSYQPASTRDPLLRFSELMEVVQLLCPRWPPREHLEDAVLGDSTDRMLLRQASASSIDSAGVA